MSRQKKIKVVQESEKTEVCMTKGAVLESLQTEIDIARIELEKTKKEIADKKAQMEAEGRRVITADEVVLVEKQISTSSENAALKAKIERQRKIDSVQVTGRFMNRRAPGQSAKLTYMKYQEDPVKWYTFEDGKVYTIPRGFADQLNDHYHTPVFIKNDGPMDPNRPQSQINDVDTSNKKYAFVPVNF